MSVSFPRPCHARQKTKKTHPVTKVSIQLTYLPDFGEEYAIQLKPWLGIGELNIKLDNGWNLTSVGIKTDQQTDEFIKSTADLISSVGDAAGNISSLGKERGKPSLSILATNIPFGFYEAVIATDPYGKKQLYGWRYIGFMPFQACPVSTGGIEHACCYDNAIYGLVFGADGVMQFRQLGLIPELHATSIPEEDSTCPPSTRMEGLPSKQGSGPAFGSIPVAAIFR